LLVRAPDANALDTLCERLRIGPMTRARIRKLGEAPSPQSSAMEAGT
jgi:hypothetical protein